jgi:hypothetical protein
MNDDSKNSLLVHLFISRARGSIYVALDSSKRDLKEFGIDLETFIKIRDEIENVVKKVLLTTEEMR